jgi:lipopolysaccharide biosynthesis protein
MKRAAVAFFYDEHGVVDEYMVHLLKSFKPFIDELIFVSNGPLSKHSEKDVSCVVDHLIIRENKGFDVWAYKEGLEFIGFDKLSNFEEVLLFNHTFYGPIFPLSEMFGAMEKKTLDFWGISIHSKMKPNPFTHEGILPEHINSHFIAIRQPMLSSASFKSYWESMPKIESYVDSILKHESRFTKHFNDLGYNYDAYIVPKDYGSDYPVFIDVAETIKNRSPILKRRSFFHTHLFHDVNGIDVPRALRLIEQTSDYNLNLIWENVSRTSKLRELGTNAALLKIIGNEYKDSKIKDRNIAVCAHIYYVDLLEEILSFSNNIPLKYDFLCSTDSEEKKKEIESILLQIKNINYYEVRLVEQNRGRDMSALFITFRDVFLSDKYDLVCRLHTKKSPQVEKARSLVFKRHLLENLLYSEAYVRGILKIFEDNKSVGMAYPPAIHNGYATLGHGWWANREWVKEIHERLALRTPLDDDTPVAPYGTMFWFRPIALRKLFDYEWKWTDFNKEPDHVDGGLAHGLERSMSYVAGDSGYISMQVMNSDSAAYNYSSLEYKYQAIMAKLPVGSVSYVASVIESSNMSGGVRESFRRLIFAIKRSLLYRSPILFRVMRPFYRMARYSTNSLRKK